MNKAQFTKGPVLGLLTPRNTPENPTLASALKASCELPFIHFRHTSVGQENRSLLISTVSLKCNHIIHPPA